MSDEDEGTPWHRNVHSRAWERTQSGWNDQLGTPHKRRGLDRTRPIGFSRRPLVITAIWWLWMAVAYFVYKLFINVVMPGVGVTHQRLYQFVLRDIWAANGGTWGLATSAWLWLAIGFIGMAVIFLAFDTDDMSISELIAIVLSFVMGLFVFFGPWLLGTWDSDKDLAKAYLQPSSQVVCVHDPSLNGQHPSSLSLMYSQKKPPKTEIRGADGRVDTVRIGDVTVKRCDLPVNVWHFEPRSSSYDAAQKSLNTKTSTRNGVNVWDPTISYAYGNDLRWGHGPNVIYPQTNRWTAVLDGSGYVNPTAGVAEWEGGQNIPHVCLFGGDHNENNKFNRAFAGGHLNNLRNVIAGRFPNLLYQDSDVSGFCNQNDQPVIVISVTSTQGWLSRTVQVPAGILVLTGSPSGDPVITYHANVNPGEYPVSVYPLSIAQTQREQDMWWAGRGNMGQFGYDVSDYASQADNSGEYILYSQTDHGMWAVTPQRPSNSKSQEFVNDAMLRVDSVQAGHWNQLSSYILPDESPLAVNPSTLNSQARSLLTQSPDGAAFLAGHGVIKEFLPLTPTQYRGYGEDVNGNTVIYFDLSTQCGSTATVVSVDPTTGGVQNTTRVQQPCGGTGSSGGTVKGQAQVNDNACAGLNSLQNASPDQIAACQAALEGTMLNRLKQTSGTIPRGKLTPTPTPSAASPSPSG